MDQTSQSEKLYQKQILQEIIDSLYNAGYYKVKNNSLNDFDKVVGGLCWCITASGHNVDVDILFQENSTIGQKISLTETIVETLRNMECPYNLQPHQIQGGVGHLLDYPAIQPVIVWLLKRIIQFRETHGVQSRAFALLQFSKNYPSLPHPFSSHHRNTFQPFDHNGNGDHSQLLYTLIQKNQPKRLYKRNHNNDNDEMTEDMRVMSCLLEFGEKITHNKSYDKNNRLLSNDNASKSFTRFVDESEEGDDADKYFHVVLNYDSPLDNINATTFSASTQLKMPIKGANNHSVSDNVLFEKQLAQMKKDAEKEEELLNAALLSNEQNIKQQLQRLSTSSNDSSTNDTTIYDSAEIRAAAELYNTNNNSSNITLQIKTVAANNVANEIDSFSSELRIKQNQQELYTQQLHQLESSIVKINQKIVTILSKSKSSAISSNTTTTTTTTTNNNNNNSAETNTDTNNSVSDNETSTTKLSTSTLDDQIILLQQEKQDSFEYMNQLQLKSNKLTQLERNYLESYNTKSSSSNNNNNNNNNNNSSITSSSSDRTQPSSSLLSAQQQYQENINQLERLILLKQSLYQQEVDFKLSSESQLQLFQQQLEQLKRIHVETKEEEDLRQKEVDELLEQTTNQYQQYRATLSTLNIQLATSSRLLDEYPTRSELIQYERRFVELYQQIAWKLDATKKYYALYNSLEMTLSVQQKEIKLLNSISGSFTEAMQSSSSRTEFLQQLELIVKGIEQSVIQQENVTNNKCKRVEELKTIYQQMVEEQREYTKLVNEFQKECDNNEWLSNKLQQMPLAPP